ncbi:hypothetical protein NIES267_01190 [Calothrix parasitica NIES-267]|uniref:Uncharacterized protein n=1 Tax=Calothrix parasitica NIES-267 TaxID=1973488 RepID=A0A1Z4LHD9_9CYAN|nr:hypothetical protein NIES267_01190 [Calothrix parasitica NIES-267]
MGCDFFICREYSSFQLDRIHPSPRYRRGAGGEVYQSVLHSTENRYNKNESFVLCN